MCKTAKKTGNKTLNQHFGANLKTHFLLNWLLFFANFQLLAQKEDFDHSLPTSLDVGQSKLVYDIGKFVLVFSTFLVSSRSGIDDFERGTTTVWLHQMNSPKDDAFFGTCHSLKINRGFLQDHLWLEFLGKKSSDHIQVTLQLKYWCKTVVVYFD